MKYKVGDFIKIININKRIDVNNGNHIPHITLNKSYKLLSIKNLPDGKYGSFYKIKNDINKFNELYQVRFESYKQYIFNKEMQDILDE